MQQSLSTTIQTRELKDVEIQFSKDIQTSEKGQHYVVLDNDRYNICLFPVKASPVNGKKSFIKFNARIHFKNSGVLFYMAIREMLEDGALIAGQAAKAQGFRAVVTEWSPAQGVAYERMAIPDPQYFELMAIISAATQA